METKKEKLVSKTSSKVMTIVGIVLCVILLPILIVNLTLIIKGFTSDDVPSIGNNIPLIVLTESMEPTIDGGDLIIIKKAKPEDIKQGDVISFYDPISKSSAIVTHRVIEVLEDPETGKILWRTQGDSKENTADPEPVSEDLLVGRWSKKGDTGVRIPYLGSIAMFMQTTTGLILCVFLPILLVVGYDMLRRKRGEKEAKDDTAALLAELELLRAQKQAMAEGKPVEGVNVEEASAPEVVENVPEENVVLPTAEMYGDIPEVVEEKTEEVVIEEEAQEAVEEEVQEAVEEETQEAVEEETEEAVEEEIQEAVEEEVQEAVEEEAQEAVEEVEETQEAVEEEVQEAVEEEAQEAVEEETQEVVEEEIQEEVSEEEVEETQEAVEEQTEEAPQSRPMSFEEMLAKKKTDSSKQTEVPTDNLSRLRQRMEANKKLDQGLAAMSENKEVVSEEKPALEVVKEEALKAEVKKPAAKKATSATAKKPAATKKAAEKPKTSKSKKVDYTKLTIPELKNIAKEKELKGYSKMTKQELVDLLTKKKKTSTTKK